MKNNSSKNYLDNVPLKNPQIKWETDDNQKVTLLIENKGVFNKIAQKFFKKPKISQIHLDENGSFVWLLIDGNKDITEIGKLVDEHFGEKSHPLYERLAKFLGILESYNFIKFKDK